MDDGGASDLHFVTAPTVAAAINQEMREFARKYDRR